MLQELAGQTLTDELSSAETKVSGARIPT